MSAVTNAVGSLFGGGGGGSAPAAPDYVGAANQTAANNLKAAQAATAANRVNQYTPYGSLEYQQTGKDAQGNPLWSATQTASPLLGLAAQNSQANVAAQYANPFTGGKLPSYGINPGETYSDAIMRRLQPQQEMQQKQFDAQMANQGIPVGSEAYQNAARVFQQGQNDQKTSAITGGMGVGLQANQQQYGQNLTNYNNALANALNIKSLATPNYINPASQQTTTGADVLGATNAQYQNQLAAYNASQAKNSSMLGGLFGLGSAALMSPTGTFSGLSGLFGGGGLSAIPGYSGSMDFFGGASPSVTGSADFSDPGYGMGV
jgi:hypothetical protein